MAPWGCLVTLPNFVVIGAMKCATTTLAVQLGAQDGIFISEPKEPNFFSNDEIHAHGLAWYESLFEDAGDAHLIGEASTHYTKLPTYPRTVERFREVLPDVKLIYVMRHPIDRLVSQYVHEWSQRLISGPIEEELDKNAWMIDYGRYAMQLTPWLEAFGPERILPVFNERIRSAPEQELQRVCDFLGYRGTPCWVESGDQNVSAQRLRKSPVRDAILDAPGLKQLRKGLVPQGVRDWAKGFWKMSSKPELSDAKRAELERLYDEDLAALGELLGHELNCANFKDIASTTPMTFQRARSGV